MKSSLKNMVTVLSVITLVCSTAVGVVYKYTVTPIENARQAKLVAALGLVLPQFDNNPADDKIEKDGTVIYTAKSGEKVVGYAIESESPNGFNGKVKLMVGFDSDGKIVNIEVLEQSETPGLGANMTKEGNPLSASFVGKVASNMNMKVKKDDGDVDALTAATISSRAYSEAVEKAYEVYESLNN